MGWATAVADYESLERSGFLNVAVATEQPGRGLGSALFTACLDHLHGFPLPTTRLPMRNSTRSVQPSEQLARSRTPVRRS